MSYTGSEHEAAVEYINRYVSNDYDADRDSNTDNFLEQDVRNSGIFDQDVDVDSLVASGDGSVVADDGITDSAVVSGDENQVGAGNLSGDNNVVGNDNNAIGGDGNTAAFGQRRRQQVRLGGRRHQPRRRPLCRRDGHRRLRRERLVQRHRRVDQELHRVRRHPSTPTTTARTTRSTSSPRTPTSTRTTTRTTTTRATTTSTSTADPAGTRLQGGPFLRCRGGPPLALVGVSVS